MSELRSSIVYVACWPHEKLHERISIMVGNVETFTDESSNIFETSFPEYRKCSESSSEEATPDNSATGKGNSKKKRSISKTTKATRPEAKKRRK